MTRIPYPDDAELDDEARKILDGLPPLNVMRMLAGAPASFPALAELGRSILLESGLDPRLRELAILAVAHASGSEYERVQHENVSRALGIPDEEIAAVGDDPDALDPEARLVVAFADEIARNVAATEERTAAVLELLGRRAATELVVCCAYYSAIARIIETCGVELEERPPTAGLSAEDAERYRS